MFSAEISASYNLEITDCDFKIVSCRFYMTLHFPNTHSETIAALNSKQKPSAGLNPAERLRILTMFPSTHHAPRNKILRKNKSTLM